MTIYESRNMINEGEQSENFEKLICAKFHEKENTAVFTTKYVLEDIHLITYVSHDIEDGAWQFFSEDEDVDIDIEARLVSLGEIVTLDPTLMELCDLPCGFFAYREDKSENWTIEKQK